MRRLLAPVALAAVLALAVPSHAAPFTYTDPADMPADGGLDILSVTYATVGKGKGKAYVPSTLVVTMTLAAAPLEQAGLKYEVEAEVAGCGVFVISYSPGTLFSSLTGPASIFLGCGGADPIGGEGLIVTPKHEIKGSSIIWTVGLKALPKEVRAGAVLSALEATVDVVEPVVGIQGSEETGGPALIDTASSDGTWKIS